MSTEEIIPEKKENEITEEEAIIPANKEDKIIEEVAVDLEIKENKEKHLALKHTFLEKFISDKFEDQLEKFCNNQKKDIKGRDTTAVYWHISEHKLYITLLVKFFLKY